MSTEPQPETAAQTPSEPTEVPAQTDSVRLYSYPKVVFLYPTFLYALMAGIWMAIAGDKQLSTANATSVGLAAGFLFVLAINLMVFSFDFPRGTSLTLFFGCAFLAVSAILFFVYYPEYLPTLTRFLRSFHPIANSTFYFLIAGILAVIYAVVLMVVRFDAWEVRPNEILHHHGPLSDLERFSAPGLRVEKEINDVFEYLLLGSGRLILYVSGQPRPIILENVMGISRKERAITQMLSALQVKVK
jgi:hypothetical protein